MMTASGREGYRTITAICYLCFIVFYYYSPSQSGFLDLNENTVLLWEKDLSLHARPAPMLRIAEAAFEGPIKTHMIAIDRNSSEKSP